MFLLKQNLYKVLLFSLAFVMLHGCSSMQSMSSYARTGDTVTIALGGTEESNALVEILKKEDITVTITDSSSNTYPVTLRHLFRVYPDHGSTYVFNTKHIAGGNTVDAYAPPLLGQWMATVDLIDPATSLSPTLAVGPAAISVSSPAQLEQEHLYYGGWSWTNGNLASIAIEILPGSGTPNSLNYLGPISHDPMVDLEPLPQILISPSAIPTSNIAGGSFTFVYTAADFAGGLIVVPANHDPNVQLSSNIIDLGDGTKQLNVMLLNPKGFLNHNNRTDAVLIEAMGYGDAMGIGQMSPLRSVRFNIVFKGQAIANSVNWQNSISMVSGSYIDLQGDIVSGITPVLTKVR